MLRSYLRLAIRTFRCRLGYTTVNALGLTVGLMCCALVAVFVQHELSWDAHHAESDRIYRILSQYGSSEYAHIRFEGFNDGTDDAAEQRSLTQRLVEAIPAVEQAANYVILDSKQYVETEEGDRFASDRQLVTTTGARFMDLFAFERVAGASLTEAFRDPGTAVLTETTAQRYFGSGADPVGQTMTVGSSTVTVRGVIADPPSNSRLQFDLALHLRQSPYWAAHQYMRLAEGTDPASIVPQVSAAIDEVDPGRLQAGMEHVRTVWGDLRPDRPFQAAFMSNLVADLYEQEQRFTTLSSVLAGIAILLAALGLTSLVAYLTRLRMKEIGIRKALGGSVGSIVALLNTEYVQIVGVAFVVGVPLAWWGATRWLQQFALQVDVSPLVFLGSGLAALAVAVAAVSLQAGRAARVDPATVLRSE